MINQTFKLVGYIPQPNKKPEPKELQLYIITNDQTKTNVKDTVSSETIILKYPR